MPLDNPNIVKLYEIYEYHNSIYLVCEYSLAYTVSAKEESCSIGWIRKEESMKRRQG